MVQTWIVFSSRNDIGTCITTW